MWTFAAGFVWYWFPDLIFPALGYFTWICWIAPENVVVNQVFGMKSGMGLLPCTLDCKCQCRIVVHGITLTIRRRESNLIYRFAADCTNLGHIQYTRLCRVLDMDHNTSFVLLQHVAVSISSVAKQLRFRQRSQGL